MAKPLSSATRPISRDMQLPPYQAPTPQELTFFSPPKGIDTVTPLAKLARENSPLITNLILDRGVLRSRIGTETYHNGDGTNRIQRTVDLGGTTSQTAPQITVETTQHQNAGGNPPGTSGWIDPDGANDGVNTLTSGPGNVTVVAANRLYNKLGDPTVNSNLDAYDNLYSLAGFKITADGRALNATGTGAVTSQVTLEYSLDGGITWVALSGVYSVSAAVGQLVTNTFSPIVAIPGAPRAQLWIRLILSIQVAWTPGIGSPGTATGSVQIFATTYLTDNYAITWKTSTSLPIAARIPIRWTETHIQTYDDLTDVSAAWTNAYTFPASQLNNDNTLPSYVTFGNAIISTDIGNVTQVGVGNPIGSKGLVSSLLSTPHTTTILAKSPRAAHLAVFGNRIVAARTNDWTATTDPWVEATTNLARLRWSVKNDATDWIGIGSGFEDLTLPGGLTDEVMGCFPVSDETAIVVSERSIRRMDVTGFVDAPFRFGILTTSLGTRSRYTIQSLPGGVIFLGPDDVYVVTLGEIKRIATTAMRSSIAQITNPRLAEGYFDQYNSRYRVAFKEGSTQVIWEYSFLDGGWTRTALPFDVVFIDRAFFQVGGVTVFGSYFTMTVSSGFSVRDNPSRTKDVDVTGADVDSPIEARTGFALVGSPLKKTQLVEVQLLYEATAPQSLIFDYSNDGGQTWNSYSAASIVATTGSTVLSVRKNVETQRLQVRVRSLTLGALAIISLTLFALEGAMIKP